MNSNKLLRVGVPALGLCLFAFVQSGCRSEVFKDRGAVPPAEREVSQDAAADDELKPAEPLDNPAPVKKQDATSSKNTKNNKNSNTQYPRFEDTDHTPIYSDAKGRKSSGTAAASSSVYIVKRGDTLGKIAARYRIKTIDLANANNLKLNSIIRVNQKLKVPGSKNTSAVKNNAKKKVVKKDAANTSRSGLYTVRRGDSISKIAKRLKVKQADLMEANNLTPNSILRPGQTLKLPGAKVVNEESVVEEKTVDKKQDEQKVIEKTPETPKNDSSDDALIRDLENDVAKNPPAKNNGAAETVDAAAKTADIPENGTPVEVSQEIHIDDYCKQHSINKAEMLKLNPKLNENSILKPNTVFVIP